MRGDQITRHWRILQQLAVSHFGKTAKEIAETGSVSLRTAYRDIQDLTLAGFPIYSEKDGKAERFKFIESYKFKIPEPFTTIELLSLELSGDLFNVFKGTVFHDSLETARKKIRAMLPPETIAYLDRVRSAFQMGKGPFKDYGRFSEIISQVNTAVTDRKTIEIGYQGLRQEERTLRKVNPYKVWFYDGTIYMIGFCHLRGELRSFVVDRINMLQLTDDHFKVPPDFSFDNFIKNSFKVMRDELYTVRIRISPKWARYVGEKVWHPSQQIQKQLDGGIEITFKVAGLEEIGQWVMSLGPEACVVEPEELKISVARSLQAAIDQYLGIEDDIGYGLESEPKQISFRDTLSRMKI